MALVLASGVSAVKMQAQGYGPPPGGQYGPPQGPPPPPPGQGGNTLRVNQSLYRGQSLVSTNGMYRLDFQGDGNVVLKHMRSGRVMWDMGTAGSPAFRLTMQDDGNVVLYMRNGRPIWNTGITGPQMRHGQVFILQDDGNLVVYSRGQVYWSSQTERRHGPVNWR